MPKTLIEELEAAAQSEATRKSYAQALRTSNPMNRPEDPDCTSHERSRRVIPGPFVKVTAAAREAMLSNGFSLPEVLRIHTSTAVHTLQNNQPGAVVMTQIALDGLGDLVIATLLGATPEENCTNIQFIRLRHRAACTLGMYEVYPMNDSGFRIRVDDTLRAEFIAACKRQDRTAAQVLRDFMRRYIDDQEGVAQRTLFQESADSQTHTN